MDGNALGGDVVMGKAVDIEISDFMNLMFYRLIIPCTC